MYWIVFIFIAGCALFEIRNKRVNKSAFYTIFTILVLMTVLRQGQGTDYYNYMEIYKEVGVIAERTPLALLIMKDPLFSLINYAFIQLGVDYKLFSAIFSFVIMMLLYRFYKTTCHRSAVALFMLYATFYLVYPFSGIRQGLTMAIVLGILYPLLKERRYWKYYTILFITSFIHQSVLICALFPLVYRMRVRSSTLIFIGAICTVVMVLGINWIELLPLPDMISGRAEEYTEVSSSTKYLAMMVRMLVVFPTFLVSDKKYRENPELNGIRNIIFMGFVVFAMLSFSDLIASRMSIYFRMFEGLFIFLLLFHSGLKRLNMQIGVYYFFIACILFTKDIGAFISQGEYRNCNIITYPYLTVFDDNQTIMYYRHNLSSADRIE